ncbi:MAG TPA: cytochrome C [Hellea balneolensis]|uniref:Cytochrome C n=1 Tax=Hellea balneolensis TaxID=287478 RepID=A0A7C3GLY8_9PROT|nr:cytochrome C [Hellea balneolensis]
MMLITFSMLSFSITSQADEFTAKNLKDWEVAFQSAVKDGRAAFTDPKLGTNGVVCAQCHPNAANTHPETYPKYQKQLGHVAPIWEMINWCIQNPLEGKKLAADDKVMLALQAYITSERKGVKLDPGKH